MNILAQMLFNKALLFFWCVLAQETYCTMEIISLQKLMFTERLKPAKIAVLPIDSLKRYNKKASSKYRFIIAQKSKIRF